MAVVHRFIRPEPPLSTGPRTSRGEADIVILPCVRRERLSDRSGGLKGIELGFALNGSGTADDARS